MKRILILMGVLITVAVNIQAQTNAANNELKAAHKQLKREERKANQSSVAYMTKQNFPVDFPDATNVNYRRVHDQDEVVFTHKGTQHIAYYDNNSKLIGTLTEKQTQDLPKGVVENINKNFPGYNIDKVVFFKDNEANDTDMWLYGQNFEDADNYFAEVSKDNKKDVLQISKEGEVSFFRTMQ